MMKFQIIQPPKIHATMIIPEIIPPVFDPLPFLTFAIFSLILIVLNN
jgi:hypothetical protein